MAGSQHCHLHCLAALVDGDKNQSEVSFDSPGDSDKILGYLVGFKGTHIF